MEDNPFPDTKIDDWSFLDSTTERTQCRKCERFRKYYCYSCLLPLPVHESMLPRVKLPVRVDIIKHPNELDGKSTSPHAAILAPDDVTVHTYPCIPDYDADKVLLVFPSKHSTTLEHIAALAEEMSSKIEQNSEEKDLKTNGLKSCENQELEEKVEPNQENDHSEIQTNSSKAEKRPHISSSKDGVLSKPSPIKKAKRQPQFKYERVVFIDSTWNQTKNIVNDERLKNLKTIELHERNTLFWRHQDGKPDTYLSTIEAIYYLVRDFHGIFMNSDYNYEYDNLLFFFCHHYSKIAAAKKEYQNKPKQNKKTKKCKSEKTDML